MIKRALTVATLLCLLGCEEKVEDALRLDHSIAPLAQSITLSLDPDQDAYSGDVEIEIEVREKTDTVRFHARDLEIDHVSLHQGEEELALDFSVGEKGTLTARAPRVLKPGLFTLKVRFRNEFNRSCEGIYKVEYEGRAYVFTQMEPEYGRGSFPCWDAPEFKIPWSVRLTTPTNFMARANAPVHSEEVEGNRKSVLFKTTKPMPSYLVAFAVGDFETVPVPGLSTEGAIIVPPGKTDLAAEAARISPTLLAALEAYFEIPYPYEKLDQIAVPEFNFGAMENVGLISYRDTALLRDPKAMTLGQRQWLALIIAHEMAHMWFGNLVTPAWWNDLWLNESFASWMATKIVNETFPEFEMANNDIKSRQRAFEDDALSTSRPIRRQIAAADAMDHLFDRLAYNKGMAVLDMIEEWMGPDAFRAGMIRYMNDHAWGVADAPALATSLGEVAEGEILDIMTSFVTQAGVPLITIERDGENRFRLTQTRYAQLGTPPDEETRWLVPMTLRYDAEGEIHRLKLLHKKRSAKVKLAHAAEWLHPNADEKGYYRWHAPDTPLIESADRVKNMSERNRLAFISNAEALFFAGLLDGGAYLETIASFSTDASPEVRQAVINKLSDFRGRMITPDLQEAYGQFVSATARPMLDRIGMDKREDEHPLIEQLRPALINALGWIAKDAEILDEAARDAQAYMKDPYSVDPSLARPYLRLAAMRGDAALFDAYVKKFETVEVPTQKSDYLSGLSGFRDKALMRRALDYALTDAVPPHMFRQIPYPLADGDVNRALVLKWLDANFPAIQAKIPSHSISYFPWLACGQDPSLLDSAQATLMTDERVTQGLEIEFAKARAVAKLNRLLRESQLEQVKRFLEAR